MIKLQVIGNLGKDCVTNTVNGKTVMNFNVAHSEKFKDNQGIQREKTIWVECAYWSDRTAIAPYLKKGTQVYADGTPELRTYQKQDGTQGVSLSLRVQSVQLLGTKNSNEGGDQNTVMQNAATFNNNQVTVNPSQTNEIEGAIDDLPF